MYVYVYNIFIETREKVGYFGEFATLLPSRELPDFLWISAHYMYMYIAVGTGAGAGALLVHAESILIHSSPSPEEDPRGGAKIGLSLSFRCASSADNKSISPPKFSLLSAYVRVAGVWQGSRRCAWGVEDPVEWWEPAWTRGRFWRGMSGSGLLWESS